MGKADSFGRREEGGHLSLVTRARFTFFGILMEPFGSLGLGEVYVFCTIGERTFGLVAICGLPLLFLAAALTFPGRALPGCAVEAQHFKKTVSMAVFLRAHFTFETQFTHCLSRGLV